MWNQLPGSAFLPRLSSPQFCLAFSRYCLGPEGDVQTWGKHPPLWVEQGPKCHHSRTCSGHRSLAGHPGQLQGHRHRNGHSCPWCLQLSDPRSSTTRSQGPHPWTSSELSVFGGKQPRGLGQRPCWPGSEEKQPRSSRRRRLTKGAGATTRSSTRSWLGAPAGRTRPWHTEWGMGGCIRPWHPLGSLTAGLGEGVGPWLPASYKTIYS